MLSDIDFDHRCAWTIVSRFNDFLANIEAFTGDASRLAAEFIQQNHKEFEKTDSEEGYVAASIKFLRHMAELKDNGAEATPDHVAKFHEK